jgi:hypothetical protein
MDEQAGDANPPVRMARIICLAVSGFPRHVSVSDDIELICGP